MMLINIDFLKSIEMFRDSNECNFNFNSVDEPTRIESFKSIYSQLLHMKYKVIYY